MKRAFFGLLILGGLFALFLTDPQPAERDDRTVRRQTTTQAEGSPTRPHLDSPLAAPLSSPCHESAARFTPSGLVLGSERPWGWQATLRYGRSNGSCTPEVQADLTTYRHANGVTEWYRRQPEGIEHGFFLAERPAADGATAHVDLALEGLHAGLANNGRDLLLRDAGGTTRIFYSKLLVWDANGRELPSTMEPTGSGIRIAYADTGAAYPVTIDPLITIAPQRLGPDPTPEGPELTNFGGAMAASGNTVVISAPMEQTNSGLGAAYVFVKENDVWSQQAKLIPGPDVDWGGGFGHAVSISGDTIVISAPWDELTSPTEVRDAGTLHVYQRSGTQWSYEAELSAADAATGDGLGHAVAIDGDAILAMACGDASNAGNNAGNAYFFHRANGLWTQQAQLPTTSESKGFSPYGYRGKYAALEGDRAVVGARYENAAAKQAAGGIFLFERTGAVWARTAHLHPPENKNAAHYGHSVELRGDSLLVSAPRDGAGRVYIYRAEMGG
jgi:hypothetical protein